MSKGDCAVPASSPASPALGSNRVPTPITDAEVFIRCDQYTMWAEQECVEADVARKLERELAEWKRRAESATKSAHEFANLILELGEL